MEDNLEKIFSENNFDIHEPSNNHESRFLEKIQQKKQKAGFPWKWMSVAASILLLITFNLGRYHQKKQFDLANISPKMEEAQLFFVTSINQKINEVNKNRNTKNAAIIDDSLAKIKDLEQQYKNFKLELKTQENQNHIIQIMIENYQQRLDVLKNLSLQLEQLNNNIKKNKYNEII